MYLNPFAQHLISYHLMHKFDITTRTHSIFQSFYYIVYTF